MGVKMCNAVVTEQCQIGPSKLDSFCDVDTFEEEIRAAKYKKNQAKRNQLCLEMPKDAAYKEVTMTQAWPIQGGPAETLRMSRKICNLRQQLDDTHDKLTLTTT